MYLGTRSSYRDNANVAGAGVGRGVLEGMLEGMLLVWLVLSTSARSLDCDWVPNTMLLGMLLGARLVGGLVG